MTWLDIYDVLTISNIEGIESIGHKYSAVYKGLKKKPYDLLDIRKVDFDHDYEDFKRHLSEIEVKSLPLALQTTFIPLKFSNSNCKKEIKFPIELSNVQVATL